MAAQIAGSLLALMLLVFPLASAEARTARPKASESAQRTDIAVSTISLDENCKVKVTFKNKGTAPIRKTIAYTIFVNRIQVAGSFLQANLEPGQEESVGAGPAGYQLIGRAQIEANIDLSNSLGEIKKTLGNNKLKKSLACTGTINRKTVRKKPVL